MLNALASAPRPRSLRAVSANRRVLADVMALLLTRQSHNQKDVAARRELSAISNQRSAPGKLFTFLHSISPIRD